MARSPRHGRSAAWDRERTAFERIRADRRRGAQALATEALGILSTLLEEFAKMPDRQLRPAFLRVARALEEAQPAMGAFLRWGADWRRIARSDPRMGRVATARAWSRRERRRLLEETPRLLRTSRKRFPHAVREVVTLSRSQTVRSVLTDLPRARRPARISVLESLPGGEGRLLARDLRRAGRMARTFPDHEGPRLATTADLVILGADAVFSDGSVVHKVGTHELARAAAHSGVPVVVVAGRSKFTGRPSPRRPLPAWFDRTPSRYISEFWTDRGVRPGGSRNRLRPHPSPH